MADEFAFLQENAAEAGLPFAPSLAVRRQAAVLPDGRRVSAIIWGDGQPDVVLLHGGGQNAHTWDTVALALDRSLVAIDLPDHGHSDPAPEEGAIINAYAETVAAALSVLAPKVGVLVGMSLGGLTAIALCGRDFARFDRLMLADILPEPDPRAAAAIKTFLAGPESFATFEAMVEHTLAFSPNRTAASIRRGVFHNARQDADGRWRWRHRRTRRSLSDLDSEAAQRQYEALWAILARAPARVTLVRGMAAGSVVTDAQAARLRALRPDAEVISIPGAGHSIQGDRPVELASAIRDFAR